MTINLEAELAVRPEPRRDRWGRYLIIPATGGKARSYTRVTTWAGALDDKEGLIKWSMGRCAVGLAARKDLFAQVAAARPDDRDTLYRLVEQAKEAGGGSEGANLGSALHAFTERIDLGEDVVVPDPWKADVEAYRQALVDAGLTVEPGLVERVVVLEQMGCAGTLDRVYRTADGRLVIGDVKTGQSLDFSALSIAVQLACYANADTLYDLLAETHEPMVDVDKTTALVVHVPAGQGTAEVLEVDIAWGWQRAELAGAVRESRSAAKRKGVVMKPYDVTRWPGIVPPESEPQSPVGLTAPGDSNPITPGFREHVLARLERFKGQHGTEPLAKCWPAGVPGMKGDHVHADAELQRIVDALETVETTMKAPEPDEGRAMEPQDVAAVVARVDRLTAEQRAVLNGWAKEANAAGVGFNLRLVPSQRRFEIYRACLRLAELIDGDDLDLCRATVAAVVLDVAQPAVPIGTALGSLTISEAELLVRVAEATRTENPALVYALDGAVTWRWPDDTNTTTSETSSETNEKDDDF